MFYAIRHFTRYRYSHSVWQSMMEVRMHPRSEGNQRCFVFQLSVNPRARIFGYTDSYGNLVHHFDLPSRHGQLTIITDALVNIDVQPPAPEVMDYESWSDLEQLVEKKDYWDMLMPSHFASLQSWRRRSARLKGMDAALWHYCRVLPPVYIAVLAT
jgi:transglutaminase-like putative cysteine protease